MTERHLLTKDERRIAVNVAKLPDVDLVIFAPERRDSPGMINIVVNAAVVQTGHKISLPLDVL